MIFKDKVIYQIYPKSFYDSNSDGIGDIQGIISKLPYLNELGVDMLWLNPIYPSPQKDNGYDVSHYTEINPMFGTIEDFKNLIEEAKKFNMGIMLDMVLNHVSTEHEWFQKALSGDKHYQDYFIIRDNTTNWDSKFGGNAWSRFGKTNQYYLHLFDKTQADLNWRNENVRQELFEVVNFWMKLGVKGFRFDVINVIGKDVELKDAEDGVGKFEYTDRPIIHEWIKELNQKTFGKDDSIITVGEMSSTTVEQGVLYTHPERNELNMIFNFHHLKVDYQDGDKWTCVPADFFELKRILHHWGKSMSDHNGWNAWFFNNHDQPRALNRFVDLEHYRIEGAQMLAGLVHLNRGTPFIYMGEEIGMINPDFKSIDLFDDVETHNAYKQLIESGKTQEEALTIIQYKSRDNSRIPMHWDDSDYCGFSDVSPWLPIGEHSYINVKNELEKGQGHIFNFYKELIQLRKRYPIVSEGTYTPFDVSDSRVFSYTRNYNDEALLVLSNFSDTEQELSIPEQFLNAEIMISNYEDLTIEKQLILKPYQILALHSKR